MTNHHRLKSLRRSNICRHASSYVCLQEICGRHGKRREKMAISTYWKHKVAYIDRFQA